MISIALVRVGTLKTSKGFSFPTTCRMFFFFVVVVNSHLSDMRSEDMLLASFPQNLRRMNTFENIYFLFLFFAELCVQFVDSFKAK